MNDNKVVVAVLPPCDICAYVAPPLGMKPQTAEFDGATIHGAWANMCGSHFLVYGLGLGIGRGQRLVLQ